ncbi:hypothetical protein ACWGI9_06410 [Streptomyces sp. NPDC054833]
MDRSRQLGAGLEFQLLLDEVVVGLDHAELISAEQAEKIVTKDQVKRGVDLGALQIRADVLKVDRTKGRQGPWRVVWAGSVTDTRCKPDKDSDGCEPPQTVVDAGTGEVYAG